MINKQELKTEQPVVYKVLSNALTKNRLAHAYLFSGQKGSIKEETAILFAQSLVCENTDEDGYACQCCDACKRIQNEESVDFHWIHGNRIKKKDIVNLQDFFSATSAEKANRRIYILEQFDQATKDAQNSLLKFLEEPSSEIYAILLADEKTNVLTTIQSRCQIVTFKPTGKKELILRLKQETNEENANMFAYNGYTYTQAKEWLEGEYFSILKEAAKSYIQHWDSLNEIYRMQREIFVAKSPLMTKENVIIWIQWLLFLLKKEENLPLEQYTEIQTILIEGLDILRSPVDLALFLDKIYNRIRKVVNK